MNAIQPTVSIGLPVYNGEAHLASALDSVLAQDFRDFELIICDNASTDRTAEICQQYATRDARIRVYRSPTNVGMVRNFNRVFELATGQYFAWIGHHDVWGPTFLSKCIAALERNPGAALCFTHIVYVDAEGQIRRVFADDVEAVETDGAARLRTLLRKLVWTTCIYGLLRSACVRQTRLFTNRYGTDDLLLCELCLAGSFIGVPEPLLFQRVFDRGAAEAQLRWEALAPQNRGNMPRFPYGLMTLELLRLIWHLPISPAARLRLMAEAAYYLNRRLALLREIEYNFVRRELKRVLPRGAIDVLKRMRDGPRVLQPHE